MRATVCKYFECYSSPSRVITDRSTCFTSLEFSSFLLDRNITHVKVAVRGDWAQELSLTEYALNNTLQRSISNTPSKLLFGVEQRDPNTDKLEEFLKEKQVNLPNRNLTEDKEKASEAITEVQEYNLKKF